MKINKTSLIIKEMQVKTNPILFLLLLWNWFPVTDFAQFCLPLMSVSVIVKWGAWSLRTLLVWEKLQDSKQRSLPGEEQIGKRRAERSLRGHQNDAEHLVITADSEFCGASVDSGMLIFRVSHNSSVFDPTLRLELFYYPGIPAMNSISGSGKMSRSTSLSWKAASPPAWVNRQWKEKKSMNVRTDSSRPQLCPWLPVWTLMAPLRHRFCHLRDEGVCLDHVKGDFNSKFNGWLWLRASGTSWEAPGSCPWPLSGCSPGGRYAQLVRTEAPHLRRFWTKRA